MSLSKELNTYLNKLLSEDDQNNKSSMKGVRSLKAKSSFRKDLNALLADSMEAITSDDFISVLGKDCMTHLAFFSTIYPLLDTFSKFKPFQKTIKNIQITDDQYSSIANPDSEVSISFFNFHFFYDLKLAEGKTLAQIVSGLDFFNDRIKNLHENALQILKIGMESRIGLYEYFEIEEGENENFVILKEIITGKKFRIEENFFEFCEEGDVYLLRLTPSYHNKKNYISHIAPCLIADFDQKKWVQYFKRQGIVKGDPKCEEKLAAHFKEHKDLNYWHEYVDNAYIGNLNEDFFILMGIPDQPKTLPRISSFHDITKIEKILRDVASRVYSPRPYLEGPTSPQALKQFIIEDLISSIPEEDDEEI